MRGREPNLATKVVFTSLTMAMEKAIYMVLRKRMEVEQHGAL